MSLFYVEVVAPCYPTHVKLDYRVHSEKQFCHDILSPDLVAVFKVGSCKTKKEAVSAVLKYAAGFKPDVSLYIGGKIP